MKNQIKLAEGNSKIHKALIWNIRARQTCPGATELCKKVCYAKATEDFRKEKTTNARDRHTAAAKEDDFQDRMKDELKGVRNYMRIHESGDFFNQKYLDDWVAVIKANPQITFWAYTKSWQLDFSEALKLPNLYLRYSVDASTKHYPKQKMPIAEVSAMSEEHFVCPGAAGKGHEVKCMRDCHFCVENREPLIFRPHGTYKKVATEMEQTILAEKDVESQHNVYLNQ